MTPLLDLVWALLAAVVVCRCIFTRSAMTSSGRIALLLIALLICPIISATDDCAAISRPNDPAIAQNIIATVVAAFALTLTLVPLAFVCDDTVAPIAAPVHRARESRAPPNVAHA